MGVPTATGGGSSCIACGCIWNVCPISSLLTIRSTHARTESSLLSLWLFFFFLNTDSCWALAWNSNPVPTTEGSVSASLIRRSDSNFHINVHGVNVVVCFTLVLSPQRIRSCCQTVPHPLPFRWSSLYVWWLQAFVCQHLWIFMLCHTRLW